MVSSMVSKLGGRVGGEPGSGLPVGSAGLDVWLLTASLDN